jgi:ATP-dependent transcriptional regulator
MGETLSLLFRTRSDGTYQVQAKESWSGRVIDGNFSPPYTSKQVSALQKKLNTLETHDNELREIGYRLFSAICNVPADAPLPALPSPPVSPTVQTVLQNVIQRTLKRRGTVALTLIFGPGCEEFIRYPWELLHNGNHFLLVSGVFTLSRALLRPDATGGCELPVHPPFRMLYISSSPVDLAPLETERSFEAMEQALAPLLDSGQIFLDRLEPPTFSQFVRYLSSYGGASMLDDSDTTLPCYVVHFDGHGAYGKLCPREGCETVSSPDARKCSACSTSLLRVQAQTYLCFCDDEGRNCFIDTQSLRGLLLSSDVRLAVFSACETATVSDEPGTDGERVHPQQLAAVDATLATAIVTAQVPAVVAMPFSLQDDLSPTFMYHFYDALADGRTLEEALSRARQALLPMQQRSWFIPVLYRHVADGQESPMPLIALDDAADGHTHPLFQLGPAESFIGREQELHDLDTLLTDAALGDQTKTSDGQTRARNGGSRIALTGSPGIGKSALALEAVRRNRDKFQGGIIGISLQEGKGFHDALYEVITQLRIPARNLATMDSKQLARLVQSTLRSLANRELPCLFIVDSFEEVKDRQELETWFQFFGSLPAEVVVLVTSRSNPEPMMALEGVHYRWYEYRVGKMTDEDLLKLFTELAASSGLDQRIHLDDPRQQAILREICTLLDGYPLGAELIFGTARSIGGRIYTPEAATRSLEEVRDELYHNPLAGILAVLEVSYSRLSEPARLLLSYLAAFRLPFSREQIALLVSPDTFSAVHRAEQTEQNASLLASPPALLPMATLAQQWRSARDELVEKSFIQFDGRLYSIHPQTRHFALSHLPIEERRRVNRLVAAYYYTLPQPSAEEWFVAFDLLEVAGEVQDLREALRISLLMAEALNGCGYTVRLLTILRRVVRYATRLNDQDSLYQVQYWLGIVLRKVGQYAEAEAYLKGSLQYQQQAHADERIAHILVELAILLGAEGDYEQSLTYTEQALSLFQQQSCEQGITHAELVVADAQNSLAHFEVALRHVELALLSCYRQHDQVSHAWALCIRGRIYEALGQYSRAVRDHEEAIHLFHDLKRLGDQAWARFYKCSVYLHQGRFDLAEKLYQELLSGFKESGSLAGEAYTLRLAGDLHMSQRDLVNAQSYYEAALALFNQLGNHIEEATIFCALGECAFAEQQYLEAREYYERAFAVTQEYNAPRVRGLALRGLGDVALVLRQQQGAARYYRDALHIFMQLALPNEQAILLERQGSVQESLQLYQEALQTWMQALNLDAHLPLPQQQRLQERVDTLVAERHLEDAYQACLKGSEHV